MLKMREDIELKEYAEKLGYTVEIKHPFDPYIFKINNRSIWMSVYGGPHWRCAELVDGSYTNHRSYDTLKEALGAERVCTEISVNWWYSKDCKPAKQPLLAFIRQHNLEKAVKPAAKTDGTLTSWWRVQQYGILYPIPIWLQIDFPADTNIVINEDWREE